MHLTALFDETPNRRDRTAQVVRGFWKLKCPALSERDRVFSIEAVRDLTQIALAAAGLILIVLRSAWYSQERARSFEFSSGRAPFFARFHFVRRLCGRILPIPVRIAHIVRPRVSRFGLLAQKPIAFRFRDWSGSEMPGMRLIKPR